MGALIFRNSPCRLSSFLCLFLHGESESSLEGLWWSPLVASGVPSFYAYIRLLIQSWYSSILDLLVDKVGLPCGLPPVMLCNNASFIFCCSFLSFRLSSLKKFSSAWRLCKFFCTSEFSLTTKFTSRVGGVHLFLPTIFFLGIHKLNNIIIFFSWNTNFFNSGKIFC